jgi:hypothetical protein
MSNPIVSAPGGTDAECGAVNPMGLLSFGKMYIRRKPVGAEWNEVKEIEEGSTP